MRHRARVNSTLRRRSPPAWVIGPNCCETVPPGVCGPYTVEMKKTSRSSPWTLSRFLVEKGVKGVVPFPNVTGKRSATPGSPIEHLVQQITLRLIHRHDRQAHVPIVGLGHEMQHRIDDPLRFVNVGTLAIETVLNEVKVYTTVRAFFVRPGKTTN